MTGVQYVLEKPLFVYGTLLDADIRREVFGRSPPTVICSSAIARGYVAKQMAGESFPRLFEDENGFSRGLLLDGFSEIALERLAFYEGDLYTLAAITVETETASFVDAIYHASIETGADQSQRWILEHWQINDKSHYLAQCRAYMRYFGRVTDQEADELWDSLK